MNKKVSIIVPIYNVSKYLPACIESIINQSYQNLEILLVDDGSTDDSNTIATRYTKKDSRIRILHQKNAGQSSARNLGLQNATGHFISFIDGDDEVKPDFIKNLIQSFTDDKTILSFCGIHYKKLHTSSANDVYINELRARKPHESFKAYILYLLAIDGRLYSSVNKLYLAKTAKNLRFDTKLNFAEDTKFVLDYLNQTSGTISFVNQPLYIYNFGTENSTMQKTATSWSNWQTSFNNLKTWLGKNPSAKEKFWLHLVHLRWRISFIRTKHRAKH